MLNGLFVAGCKFIVTGFCMGYGSPNQQKNMDE
jgi:hypothetical protein